MQAGPTRGLIAAALASAVIGAVALSPAPAEGAITRLGLPQPWLVDPGGPFSFPPTVVGPSRRAFPVVSGAGSGYFFQRIIWRGWGGARAVGRGRARYCGDACARWYPVTIIATGPTSCGLHSGRRYYRTYRVVGADGEDTRPRRAAHAC